MLNRLMWPALAPQLGSNGKGIDLTFLPPSPLIASCVIFTMVDGAKGHGEFITDFESQTSWLCIANVMGVGRGSAADHARLAGYET